MLIDRVQSVKWYRFDFDEDTWYSVHIAYRDKKRESPIVICADTDTLPSAVARDNNIRYTYMRNASDIEVKEWCVAMSYTIIDEKEI